MKGLYLIQLNDDIVKEYDNYISAKRGYLKIIEKYINKINQSILLIRNADDYQIICEFYN